MSGKKSSPAPADNSTPQTDMPSMDTATMAAKKALDAQQGAATAVMADTEQPRRQQPSGLAQTQQAQPRRPRPERDRAAMANQAGGNIASSAVLTG